MDESATRGMGSALATSKGLESKDRDIWLSLRTLMSMAWAYGLLKKRLSNGKGDYLHASSHFQFTDR